VNKKVIVVLILTLFMGFSVFAMDLKDRFGVGAALGFYEPDKVNGTDQWLENEFIYGGYVKYFWHKNWSIEGRYEVWDHDDDYPASATFPDGSQTGDGSYSLDIKPFSLNVCYHFPNQSDKKVMPYVGLGATYFDVEYKYHTITGDTAGYPGFSGSENKWGFNLLAGVEYFTNPNFSIRGEIRYLNGDVAIDVNNNGLKEKIDCTGFAYGVCLTYYFEKK